MKKNIFLAISIFLMTLNCKSQSTINEDLKKQLEQIVFVDQIYREFIDNNTTQARREEIAKLTNNTTENLYQNVFKIIEQNDKTNFEKVEKIVEKYGYPGKELVGEKLSNAVWYVIQHSKLPIIEKYFPLMIKAQENGDLSKQQIAMMKDRMLMYQGKEQIYGTQGAGRLFVNPETKKEEWTNFIWPIENPEKVNELRTSMDIKMSIEEYAKSMGIDYSKKYTLKEIEKLTKK